MPGKEPEPVSCVSFFSLHILNYTIYGVFLEDII